MYTKDYKYRVQCYAYVMHTNKSTWYSRILQVPALSAPIIQCAHIAGPSKHHTRSDQIKFHVATAHVLLVQLVDRAPGLLVRGERHEGLAAGAAVVAALNANRVVAEVEAAEELKNVTGGDVVGQTLHAHGPLIPVAAWGQVGVRSGRKRQERSQPCVVCVATCRRPAAVRRSVVCRVVASEPRSCTVAT